MNWSKIIYRVIIINAVFHAWWNSTELGHMPWWIAVIAGTIFGFVIDFDEEV